MHDYENNDRGLRIHILQAINKLKQICNFSEQNSRSSKIEAVKEIVEEAISSGEKVIIFSQFKKAGIDKLRTALGVYGLSVLTGDMSSSQREAEVEKFRNDSNIKIFLISVRAGGTGLTLTEASYVIHFDHWWNPAVLRQAEDRVHRLGQNKPVNVYELWVENTIEEGIKKILEAKTFLAGDVIDDLAEDTLRGLSIEELLRAFEIDEIPVSKWDETTSEQVINSKPISQLEILRSKLLTMSPEEFEKLVVELYRKKGYQTVTHVGQSGDRGIDALATRFDENGKRIEVGIQCKRYQTPVGVDHARNLIGAVEDKKLAQGILITTSDFTRETQNYAHRNAERLELVNGETVLRELLKFGIFS